MRRFEPLVSFSHEHHHALAQARRLTRAAARHDGAERRPAAIEFLRFFEHEALAHFADEEALLFTTALLAGVGELTEAVVVAMLDHAELRRLGGELRAAVDTGEAPTEELLERFGAGLTAHVRHEERVLFEQLQQVLGTARLAEVVGTRAPAAPTSTQVLRLLDAPPLQHDGGVRWFAAPGDLNVTLVEWQGGAGVAQHVNDELDVLLVLRRGSCVVMVDSEPQALFPGDIIVVPCGARRSIEAGIGGVSYLSVHRNRGPLQLRDDVGRFRAALAVGGG